MGRHAGVAVAANVPEQPVWDGNDVGARSDGTFTVHTRSGGCDADLEEHMLVVHPDGTIETEVSELIEEGDPSCAD